MSEPIEARYRNLMNALAAGIEEVLGGLGFALLMFERGKVEGGRVNYISNSNREDMVSAMREFLAREEGRVHEAPEAKQ